MVAVVVQPIVVGWHRCAAITAVECRRAEERCGDRTDHARRHHLLALSVVERYCAPNDGVGPRQRGAIVHQDVVQVPAVVRRQHATLATQQPHLAVAVRHGAVAAAVDTLEDRVFAAQRGLQVALGVHQQRVSPRAWRLALGRPEHALTVHLEAQPAAVRARIDGHHTRQALAVGAGHAHGALRCPHVRRQLGAVVRRHLARFVGVRATDDALLHRRT